MLNVIADKQFDIYLALVMMVIGWVFNGLMDRWRQEAREAVQQQQPLASAPVSFHQTVDVAISIHSTGQDENGAMILFSLAILAAGVAYVFLREEILGMGLFIVLCVVGFWVGASLRSLFKVTYAGWAWYAYLLVMLGFAAGAIHVVSLARVPLYAPSGFQYIEMIAHDSGLAGIKRSFNQNDLYWFMMHLAGVLVFFAAALSALLSMFFSAVVGASLAHGEAPARMSWLVRAASRAGRRPLRHAIFLCVALVAASYLVSGRAFVWLQNDGPVLFNHFMQYLLHGSRGT